MTNWMRGPGFYIVQPSGPINEKEYTKQLEEVKRKLEAAEKLFAAELFKINYVNT